MQYVEAQLHNTFIDLGADYIVQGMAAGVDLLSAHVAYDLKIPYSSVIPWAGHVPVVGDEVSYKFALDHAASVHIVNNCVGSPGNFVYQERNEFMVDRCHILVAVWDGQKKGGTWNTVKYAMSKRVPIWIIDPSGDTKSGWYEYK